VKKNHDRNGHTADIATPAGVKVWQVVIFDFWKTALAYLSIVPSVPIIIASNIYVRRHDRIEDS
jgi:hypothetical protein